ncbi:hypothetical protein [Leptospira noguchii]|nr:hypothetical protein [Leptospira noguchii]
MIRFLNEETFSVLSRFLHDSQKQFGVDSYVMKQGASDNVNYVP